MGEIIIGKETASIEISSITYWSTQRLTTKMKRISLMSNMGGDGPIYPYQKSIMSVVALDPNILVPAQYYVLEQELKKIKILRNNFLKKGIDIFDLRGYVNFTCNSRETSMYPPVVEISEADGGIVLICDGMHRIYSARKGDNLITVLLIDKVNSDYPYYALPNKGGWSDVKFTNAIPEIKKRYRFQNYRDYYRNFNVEFPGSTGFRINASA